MRNDFHRYLIVPAAIAIAQAQTYPRAEIANESIRMELYLPDSVKGYYRGTRFDWSGVIESLRFAGHEYFGPWLEKHDPLVHDSITGPVEAFDTNGAGLGYAEAQAGGQFIRIGVGVLEKPAEPAYRTNFTYKIVDPGKWTVKHGKDWIEFEQRLTSKVGYAYSYRKRISLTSGKPEMVIGHWLTNRGSKPIDTSQFNHNFLRIDRQMSGTALSFRFPFEPRMTTPMPALAEVRGREIVLRKEFDEQDRLYSLVEGYGATAADHEISVENRATGAGVRITGDRPLSRLIVWSKQRSLSPETYVSLHVAQGETQTWERRYWYYTIAKR